MKYIGIVNEIKEKHKSGFYGKKPLSKKEEKKKVDELSKIFESLDLLPTPIKGLGYTLGTFGLAIGSLVVINKQKKAIRKMKENPGNKFEKINISNNIKNYSESIELKKEIKVDKKILIFTKNSFDTDYSVNNSEYLYGLFEQFPNPNLAFENILKSKGGSELNIFQKKGLPKNFNHINKGHFNEGIYIIHPKNENIIIPLKNSNKLIESLILEETIRAYEALGAKKVIINDVTKKEINADLKIPKMNMNANFNNQKELLREKTFGRGVFSPERALKNKYFIQDIPSIMTTIEGRINGNQIQEKYKETVDLSVGLDANVLSLYKGGINYNFLREWSFEVEFYDKNEIKLEK